MMHRHLPDHLYLIGSALFLYASLLNVLKD
jgi:hypothetical protein